MRTTYLTCLVLIEYDEKLFYALFSNFSVGTINSVVIGTFPLSLIIIYLCTVFAAWVLGFFSLQNH